ncbi:MAG: hypothetical protein EBU11_06215 [Gammaproteobacteria bacterium]|nr:hypothetical protein [Gammaproteobacteria bacterium]
MFDYFAFEDEFSALRHFIDVHAENGRCPEWTDQQEIAHQDTDKRLTGSTVAFSGSHQSP